MLVSIWGERWKEVRLVLFTIYIDDSGTDPKQQIAIATALIIPAIKLIPFQNEWDKFRAKEGFKCFHTSPFISRDRKSEFANWSDIKQQRVWDRVLQISKKYGMRAISIAVKKTDYIEVVPASLRLHFGQEPYSWAVRQLLVDVGKFFPPKSEKPREFIFQWIERHEPARKEIENIMDQMQFASDREGTFGDYSDPHFRKSDGIPGLQCADAAAWTSYQFALQISKKTINPLALHAWKEFGGPLGVHGWLRATTIRREHLEKSIQQAMSSEKPFKFFEEWLEHRAPSKPT